jgi:ABC-type multidrug transport system fused ATPase/permease subunit
MKVTSGSIRASRNIHNGVVDRLFKAPLDFFDGQPLGRILNRLSVDVEAIDFRLVNASDALLLAAISMLASIVVLLTSSVYLVVILPAVAYVILRIQSLYRV